MTRFASKVVLITGSSAGIGAATAKAFAKEGACLTITGRNEERLDKVFQECKQLGAKDILQIVADLKNRENLNKLIDETVKKFGKLDVLVNNAGDLIMCTLETFKEETFEKMMDINVKVPIMMSQLAVPHLEKTAGNIVNISGITSTVNAIHGTLLCALAKATFDKVTKLIAVEVAGKNIRVNSVNPSAVPSTSLFDSSFPTDEEKRQLVIDQAKTHILGNKNVEIDEVVDSILFLASDGAKAITGTKINVDRGRVLIGL